MVNIDNVRVYDLGESIVAAGLPMQAMYVSKIFTEDANIINKSKLEKLEKTHWLGRARRLAANPPGSGHNNFLSGILVSANITATVKWWQQMQRYHFIQIVSSMSTMHRLRKMILDGTAVFADKTSEDAVKTLQYMAMNKDTDDETLVYSCPIGLCLTARISTNYLQLKTVHAQRKAHKLKEWRDFCEWIESLPLAKTLICPEDAKHEDI